MFFPDGAKSAGFYSSVISSSRRRFEVENTKGIAFAVGIFRHQFFRFNYFNIEMQFRWLNT